MKTLILAVSVLALSGCSALSDKQLKIIDDAITRGQEITDEALTATAKTLDDFCRFAPDSGQEWLEGKINEKTEVANDLDFCPPQ